MALPKEVDKSSVVENKITEDFLHRRNLQVIKHFENAPTLIWAVEYLDYPSDLERPDPPIVLIRSVDKNRDIVSIRVNSSFSRFKRNQQIMSIYYIGQLSYEQGSLDSVTLDGSLQLQTIHTIADVLQYSRKGDFSQLLNDLADENGWLYTRLPRG